ncbi:MAG: twin-arginine translocase TatA/TatE family subunit [Planctomycetota bacterium]|nr:twin-arginine translocase TatA/TatE family subunit [Planctomycetota bacterium]
MLTLGFLQNLNIWEIGLLLLLGLLLFGKRLPDVGKSLGKGIVEFKKGLRGIEEDVDQSAQRPQAQNQPAPSGQYLEENRPYRPPLMEGGQDPRVVNSGYGMPAQAPAQPAAQQVNPPAGNPTPQA